MARKLVDVVTISSAAYNDLQDLARCANYAANIKRCKLCRRYNIDGYVCIHCGKDDSALASNPTQGA